MICVTDSRQENYGISSRRIWPLSDRHIMGKFQREYAQLIHVKPVAVFNMTNTSMVLGLEPADERLCLCLMEMYENQQRVKKLDHLLTFYITLAYFKPGIYGRNAVFRLRNALIEINDKNMPMIELSIHQLLYQRVDDMNHYYSVKE